MRTRIEPYTPTQHSDTLVVLLPPALTNLDDFETQGFVHAVQQRKRPLDLLLADISAQHVLDKTVVHTLHTEVIQPALAKGYRSIWLAGISMGACNALHYASHHAELLAGVYLMAPYPGTRDVLAEIHAAGGVRAWCDTHPSTQDDRQWWRWLGEQAMHEGGATEVHFGTGDEDRFGKGQQMLSALLPPHHVHILPGGHQWATWKALWTDWLDRGPLASSEKQTVDTYNRALHDVKKATYCA